MALSPEVREGSLTGVALDQAVRIAVRAFDDDPFFSYLFPDQGARHRSVGRLHRSVIRHLSPIALTRTAYLGGDVAGVAVWVPPGRWPLSARVQIPMAFGNVRAFLPDVGSLGRAGRIVRSVERAHPKTPLWYLQLLMVDPDVQRQGIGGLLQAPILELCDAEAVPAWLETQKEENLAYYGRFGFTVAHEHHPVPEGPKMWSMRREPRSQG